MNLIYFRTCPEFSVIRSIAKEFYVIKTYEHGGYAIVIELKSNGKVNHGII